MNPATYGCEMGRVEDEPVYLRLRSARPDTTITDGDVEPVIELTVMPFMTWQIVKRRMKERWLGVKAVPDQNIRLLHKSVELRSGSMIDDYNMDGGTADRPVELQYLIIDQGTDIRIRRGQAHSEHHNIGLYVDAQVFCTPSLRERVSACLGAMLSGIQPRLTEEGTGATYMLRDTSNRRTLAVFKPKDEEAFAPQNPRGYVGPENTHGLRLGVLSTQQAAREVAAHLLDHEKFASVPETTLVHAKHPKFNKVKGKSGEKIVWKIGAFQAFIETQDTAGNYAPQVFAVADVHRIGILDVRIVNLDRNDGNLLVRHGRGSSKYELVPIDHGLSLPDCLEVFTDDIAWMTWPQAKKPFGETELSYIKGLNGSRDAHLLAKCLGVRRECLRLMEVTTKLLQIGAEHGLTLYEIGTIIYRIDRGGDAPVQKSKLEQLVEYSLDAALTVAGDGLAADAVSSTLAGLDLVTSRQLGTQRMSRQVSVGAGEVGFTPHLGPSSPISSPVSTSPAGLDMPPPFSLDGLSESDSQDPVDLTASMHAGATRDTKRDETDSSMPTPSKQTPKPFRQSYKAGGTKLRQRTSAALVAMHREGEGAEEHRSIFSRTGLRGSDWSPELEKAFKRSITAELAGFIRKNFQRRGAPQALGSSSTVDSEPSQRIELEKANVESDEDSPPSTSLASAFPRASLECEGILPPHCAGSNLGDMSGVMETTQMSSGVGTSQLPLAAQGLRPKYVPPQRRVVEDSTTALAVVEEEAPLEVQKPKYIPPFLRKAMAAAAAAEREDGSSPSGMPAQPTSTPSMSSTATPVGGSASPVLPSDASGGSSRYGYCVNQGPRASMEDAVDATCHLGGSTEIEFYVVYDGHGGTQAVEFVKNRLPGCICGKTNFTDRASIDVALCESFKQIDAELLRHLQHNTPPQLLATNAASYVLSSGCVACAAIVISSVVYVANLGDCRAIMCTAGEMTTLTVDHRPEGNDEERERLQNLGIEVSSDGYVHGRIGVSRAFGDWAWDAEEKCKGLLCQPDVSVAEIASDTEFLLLACDGVFEKMTNREAGQIVRRRLRATGDPKEAAEALIKNAGKRNGSDNLSAVVVLFKRPADAAVERTAPRLFARPAGLVESNEPGSLTTSAPSA